MASVVVLEGACCGTEKVSIGLECTLMTFTSKR